MKKFLTILLVLLLTLGMAGAVTKTLPKWGPAQGFQTKAIQVDTITADTITASTNITNGVFADDLTLDSGYDFTANAGDGKLDFSLATGFTNTTTGTNYFNGDGIFATGKNLTLTATVPGVGGDLAAMDIYAAGTLGAAGVTSLNATTVTNGYASGTLGAAGATSLNATTATTLYTSSTLGAAGITSLNATTVTNGYASGTLGAAGTTGLNYTTVTDIRAADDGYFAGDLTAGTLAAFNYTTVTDIRASDDAYFTDDVGIGGIAALNETTATTAVVSGHSHLNQTYTAGLVASGTANLNATQVTTLVASGYSYLNGTTGTNIYASGTLGVAGLTSLNGTSATSLYSSGGLQAAGTAALNATTATTLVASGDAFLNGTTIGATDALAVTTADKLTVGGVIVPQETVITFPYTASSVDQQIFTAKEGWQITAVRMVPAVAGTNGGAVTVMVKLCDDAEAPASGDNALSGTLDLKGTVNTLQSGSLSGTPALASGDSLALDFTGTLTEAVGVVTVYMKRV